MAKFNFVTALQNAISDPASYASFQKEASDRAFAELYSKYAGKTTFEAVVLPKDLNSDITDQNTLAIRVRPTDLDGFIIPEPCDAGCPQKSKMILALHPIAYPALATPAIQTTGIQPGQKVLCAFEGDGPNLLGRQRGIVYYPNSISNSPLSSLYNCLNGTSSPGGSRGRRPTPQRNTQSRNRNSTTTENSRSQQNLYERTGQQPDQTGQLYDEIPDADSDNIVDETEGKVYQNSGSPNAYSWDDLLTLAKDHWDAFEPIGDSIGTAESGRNYNNFNLADRGGGGSIKRFKEYYGKSLTEMNIATVREKAQKLKVFNNKNNVPAAVFAAGWYQIIPDTMELAMSKIKGIDTRMKFDEISQKALALYLMLQKQPKLGEYLRGNGSEKDANIALAAEWAGIRLAYPAKKGNSPRQPGESYHKGSSTNPTDSNVQEANAQLEAMKDTREKVVAKMQSDPQFKALIESYKN